jgi:integrase
MIRDPDGFATPLPAPSDHFGVGPFALPGPIPFDRFRAELDDLYRPPLRSASSRAKMAQVLGLVAALGVESTDQLTPALVARFVASRPAGESANTTAGYLDYLRAACGLAAAQCYLRLNPFAVRKRWVRRVAPQGKRHHSAAEIARVLELLRADVAARSGWARWRARRLQALVATVAYCGLRKMEALRLEAADVDLDRGMIFLTERGGRRLKTERSAQPIPIPEALAAILAPWLEHRLAAVAPDAAAAQCPWLFPGTRGLGPWLGGGPGQGPLDRLKAAGARAGVEGFTFTSLRHSYATMAESRWGFGPALIQRILRHTTVRTQDHYRHADAENLRAAVRGIDFGPASPEGEAS